MSLGTERGPVPKRSGVLRAKHSRPCACWCGKAGWERSPSAKRDPSWRNLPTAASPKTARGAASVKERRFVAPALATSRSSSPERLRPRGNARRAGRGHARSPRPPHAMLCVPAEPMSDSLSDIRAIAEEWDGFEVVRLVEADHSELHVATLSRWATTRPASFCRSAPLRAQTVPTSATDDIVRQRRRFRSAAAQTGHPPDQRATHQLSLRQRPGALQ